MIAIVVPVRDRRDQVLRCLDSIAAQTRLPEELIVVDNGSSDGTPEAVSRWLKLHGSKFGRALLLSEPRPGASAARNRGLAEVTADITVFFDSDDQMMPPHLERVARLFDTIPDLELTFCDRMLRDDEGWTRVKAVDDDDFLRGHLLHCALQTDAMAARTELLRRCGGFDESLPRWNDYEFGVRLLLESRLTRKLTGDPTVQINPQPVSITGTGYSRSASDLERALDTIERELISANRRHETLYVAARRATLAAHYIREGDSANGNRLIDQTLSGARKLPLRFILFMIYLSVRLTGHGGAALARLLLPPPRPTNKIVSTKS